EVGRELGHHDAAQGHHHAAREVDASREDDQRLADRDHADHRPLLQDERQVFWAEETIGRDGEECAGDCQRNEGSELTDRWQLVFQGVHAGAILQAAVRSTPDARHPGTQWAVCRLGCRSAYFLPQQSSVPVLTSLLSTPVTGLSAISVTPVSV